MRPGVRIGVDVGKVRIGISQSDRDGLIATPVETVLRSADGSDQARVQAIITELGAFEVIVGLPLALSGAHTASTADAITFAEEIAAQGEIPVRLVDERLSTVSAAQSLRTSGKNAKTSRAVIDQVAATIILQHALDSERASGTAPGTQAPSNIGS